MSMEMASEHVCYVHCNFCNTILAVSVPNSNMLMRIVTVKCGHCSNLLSINMAPPPPQFLQRGNCVQRQEDEEMMMMMNKSSSNSNSNYNVNININGSSSSSSPSSSNGSTISATSENEPPRTPPVRPPEKKQRAPSAYNKFIKEEIQRVKSIHPDITHREAFSLAAKNWAHFPRIHFGLSLEGQKQASQAARPGLY